MKQKDIKGDFKIIQREYKLSDRDLRRFILLKSCYKPFYTDFLKSTKKYYGVDDCIIFKALINKWANILLFNRFYSNE